MQFEYIYEDESYDRMRPIGTIEDAFSTVRTFRSMDQDQTYTVRIIRDTMSTNGAMYLNATRKGEGTFTEEERAMLLNSFFPNRISVRDGTSTGPNHCVFVVVPGPGDLMLPWYTNPFIPYHN